jgi:hypothetical protein
VRLGNQPRVLHRNDRLSGEALQECDLLFRERASDLAIDGNCAEQRIVFVEPSCQQGAAAANLDKRPPCRVAPPISVVIGYIGDVDQAFAKGDPLHCRPGPRANRSPPPQPIGNSRLPLHRDRGKALAIINEQLTVHGPAKAHSLFQDRVKYRHEIAPR